MASEGLMIEALMRNTLTRLVIWRLPCHFYNDGCLSGARRQNQASDRGVFRIGQDHGRTIAFQAATGETVQFARSRSLSALATRALPRRRRNDHLRRVDEIDADKKYKRIFSGGCLRQAWSARHRASIYDIWLTECKAAPLSRKRARIPTSKSTCSRPLRRKHPDPCARTIAAAQGSFQQEAHACRQGAAGRAASGTARCGTFADGRSD